MDSDFKSFSDKAPRKQRSIPSRETLYIVLIFSSPPYFDLEAIPFMKTPETSYSPGPLIKKDSLSPREVVSAPLCSSEFRETKVMSAPNLEFLYLESLETGLTAIVVLPNVILK